MREARERGVLDMLREGTLDSEDEERLEAPHEGANSVTRTICMQEHRWGGWSDEYTWEGC